MKPSALVRAAAIGLACWSLSAATCAKTPETARWTATWSASPDSPGPSLEKQTIRQIVRVSAGGDAVRIRLSNLYGEGPVTIGPVQVAIHSGKSQIRPGSDRTLTFSGKSEVTIPAGADVLSDSVDLEVAALQELAISLYLPGRTGPTTVHSVAMQTGYLASGDATAATSIPDIDPEGSRFFLTDVDVSGKPGGRVLVTLGDSITDGVGSTEDANRRWPDLLAARLQADPSLNSIAVVNSGIAGNRMLNDGLAPYLGPSTLKRFDRDVLDKPGVRWVILLQGTNDISASERFTEPEQRVSSGQIIAGMKGLIARAHAKDIEIWGATLTPHGGAKWPFDSPAGEEKRQAVNAWILTSGAFDAVVDFDQVVRDPAQPGRMLPAYDSGDHVHPNDAGFQAMADAIDVKRLRASADKQR